MNRRDLIAFASRNWQLLAESKAEHWRRRKLRLGPGEGIRVAEELRRWVRQARPHWPSPEARQADLACHVRVGEMLRRVRLD